MIRSLTAAALAAALTTHANAITTNEGDYAGFSNTTGTIIDAGGPCSVKAWGAKGDGTTNDYTAINNAWSSSACKAVIYFPPGNYLIGTALSGPATAGASLIGAGHGASTITANFTTGDVITLHASVADQHVSGLTITRSSQATTGCGLNTNTVVGTTFIDDIVVSEHNIGLCLGGIDWGVVKNVIAQNNRSDGVNLSSTSNSLQWQLNNILSQSNGGNGFSMIGNTTNGTSVGQWRGLSSYNNTGYGIELKGVTAVRMQDSFFGGDGSYEVLFTQNPNATYAHMLTNVETELGGASGFEVLSDNNSPIVCVNCGAVGNQDSGFVQDGAATVSIVGGFFVDNGRAQVAGNRYGINAIASNIIVTGTYAPTSTNQTDGILTSTTGNCSIVANNSPTNSISCTGGTAYSAGNF